MRFYFRGRYLKRLVYTSVGAGLGTAVCYPNEASELSGEAYSEIRKKALIAYNFVTGGDLPCQGCIFFLKKNSLYLGF